MLFERVSGMKINFHKSEVIPMNLDDGATHNIAHILACPIGVFPVKYLGVPLYFDQLRREDVQPLVDKLIKRIAGWRGRLLAYSSRLTLVKTCLASVPVYLLSFIKFPKWAIRLLESQMAHCLWNNDSDSHKYHLANWQLVSMRKEFGGLGVPNLRDLNICLLGSWLKRYCLDKEKTWKQLIDYKYKTTSPNFLLCKDVGASNFWKGIMWAAQVARMGFRWKVGRGDTIRFWEDIWLDSSSLAIQYWEIYSIINEQNGTIAELWDGCNLRCTFRRTVDIRLFNLWEEVLSIASSLVLSSEDDEPVWQFHSSGVYSSQSLYRVINFRGVIPVYIPAVWKLRVPPRIHFFLWLLSNNKLLTRDNLEKRRKVEDTTCLFCHEPESVAHLFFGCVVATQAWGLLAGVIDFNAGTDYESMAKCWLCNTKFGIVNILSSAVCWGIWKLRNYLCFQGVVWRSMKQLWSLIIPMLRCWHILLPLKMADGFNVCHVGSHIQQAQASP
jgi:hypothetical protein